MKPDLFVDSNVSGHFAKPVRADYKTLIEWLRDEGCLVVCQSLIKEYHDAVQGSQVPTTLVALVNKLQRGGRLRRFSKKELQAFSLREHVRRRLRSNRADHDLIKVVMLSDRKLALSKDRKLAQDINDFPGFDARCEDAPSKMPYRMIP